MSIKSWIRQRKLNKIWRNPPVIWTYVDGIKESVDEGMRRKAAFNLSIDPEKMSKVIGMLGEEETHRRYPEAFIYGE